MTARYLIPAVIYRFSQFNYKINLNREKTVEL